ncbi:astacin-like [Orbicella faveolata]|uniref:astacin-like n=1 Tax=Orbicella faveolata TaxID=48498 RepID=UPI0009E5AB51|nr:astacin-like [Orbicella faveolata]
MFEASSMNSDAIKWAKTVIHQLSQDTCIDLIEGSEDDHEVEFTSGNGCSSWIGHIGDSQDITLGNGCHNRGTIAHEIMHMLGFYHEHTRLDRDQYITVYNENILDGYSSEFDMRSQNNFGYSYDKHSIMQYKNTAFGKKQSDGTDATTMESKSDPSETLGAVSHMDANDLEKINSYYECSNAPSFVDHTITLSTKENTWLSCCHGTDGYVYVKLVGNSGASPWQLVTSGGQLYADENEGGDVQTHKLPFPDVGTISSVKVALEAEGDIKTRKRRSVETKAKRLFDGWTLENLALDGVSYGGGELDVGDELTLTA